MDTSVADLVLQGFELGLLVVFFCWGMTIPVRWLFVHLGM